MKDYPEPDLEIRISADVWVLVYDQRPPEGAYVTATHIPYVQLAWKPREEPNDDQSTDIRRQDPLTNQLNA